MPMTISIRSLRAGSWFDRPWVARASYRDGSGPSYLRKFDGFRCALTVWRRQ